MRSIIKKQKKAQVFNIFTFIIFAFLVVLLFAGWIYVSGKLNTIFHDVGLQNEANAGRAGYTNMTLASDQIWGQMNTSIQALKMVALVYILSLGVVIIITNGLMKIHPIFYFAYVLMVILAVVFAPTISNAYENILNSGLYEGTLTGFTASNFILLNLPTIVLVIGILGGILLFVNLIRGNNEGQLQ